MTGAGRERSLEDLLDELKSLRAGLAERIKKMDALQEKYDHALSKLGGKAKIILTRLVRLEKKLGMRWIDCDPGKPK
ncbi:MAG: hypothetical protein ACREJQ_02720 [bacterium]